jgi:hypothetical protein
MAQQRMPLWAAEEIDEDLQDVDLGLAIGSYGQNEQYDDGLPYSTVSTRTFLKPFSQLIFPSLSSTKLLLSQSNSALHNKRHLLRFRMSSKG